MAKVIGIFCIALSVLFLLGAVWIARIAPSGMTLIHPGPLALAIVLALVSFISGLLAFRLPKINSEKISELENQNSESSRKLTDPPMIEGLEHVVQRWETFHTTDMNDESARKLLAMQIKMLAVIAQQKYRSTNPMQIHRYFTGASIYRGAFLVNHPDSEGRIVLKLDSIENITKEIKRYEHFVKPHLMNTHGQPTPHGTQQNPLEEIERKPWGAIQYDFLANVKREGTNSLDPRQIRTFADFYKDKEVSMEQMSVALREVFERASKWWDARENTLSENVKSSLKNDLRDEYDRISYAMTRYQGGLEETAQNHPKYAHLRLINREEELMNVDKALPHLYNPLHWVAKVFQHPSFANKEWLNPRHNSIVHGDFHAGNILVTSSPTTFQISNVWLIDFPQVHFGPTVQDLARLEADIKFGLIMDETGDIPEELKPADLYEFECDMCPSVITSVPIEKFLLRTTDKQVPATLQRAWSAIEQIRKKAKKYLTGSDPQPYYLALLHSTLPVLYYTDRTPYQKLYALISASLLCERLRE